jgi:hypothetical protein
MERKEITESLEELTPEWMGLFPNFKATRAAENEE